MPSLWSSLRLSWRTTEEKKRKKNRNNMEMSWLMNKVSYEFRSPSPPLPLAAAVEPHLHANTFELIPDSFSFALEASGKGAFLSRKDKLSSVCVRCAQNVESFLQLVQSWSNRGYSCRNNFIIFIPRNWNPSYQRFTVFHRAALCVARCLHLRN